jgi:hypothetical protein
MHANDSTDDLLLRLARQERGEVLGTRPEPCILAALVDAGLVDGKARLTAAGRKRVEALSAASPGGYRPAIQT